MSQYPPISAGTTPTTTVLNAMLDVDGYKSGSQSVTSSTTLVSDSALLLALPAGSTWRFRLNLLYQAATAGNLKFGWSVPSGCALAALAGFADTGLIARWGYVNQSTVQAVGGNGGTSPLAALVEGTIALSLTAGNVTLQWAQNTSNATATTVLAGSIITARRIA